MRWHWFHRWSKWSRVEAQTSDRSSRASPEVLQVRFCLKCGKTQMTNLWR